MGIPVTKYIELDLPTAVQLWGKNRLHEPGKKGTNRKISSAKVRKYTADMLGGHWHTTHQGIGFNERDEMVDGQHRVLAFLEACKLRPDLKIIIAITHNLPMETYKYVDMGRQRKLSDALSSQGHTNVGQLAATSRLVHHYFHTPYEGIGSWMHGESFNTDLMDETIEKYPSILMAVDRMAGKQVRKVGNVTALGAAYTIAWELRPDLEVDLFFHELIQGTRDIKKEGDAALWSPEYPAYELRERLLGAEGTRKLSAKIEQLAWMVQAFNAFAENGRVKRGTLRIMEKQAFPRIKPAPVEEDVEDDI